MDAETIIVPALESSPEIPGGILDSIKFETEIIEETAPLVMDSTSTIKSMCMEYKSEAIKKSTGIAKMYTLVNFIVNFIKYPFVVVKRAIYFPYSAGKQLVDSIKLRAGSFEPSVYVQRKCNAAILKIKVELDTISNNHKLVTLERKELYGALKYVIICSGLYFAGKKEVQFRAFKVKEILRIMLIRLRFNMLVNSLENVTCSSKTILSGQINVLLNAILSRLMSLEPTVSDIKDTELIDEKEQADLSTLNEL